MYDVQDVSEVLGQAVEGGYVNEEQSAQLAGLFIARAMVKKEREASNLEEAQRLLGWAEFNLGKGKVDAAETLIKKARAQLDGVPDA